MSERRANFECLECGRKFRSVGAAERAASRGCPGCGGVDIELTEAGTGTVLTRRELVRELESGPGIEVLTEAEELSSEPSCPNCFESAGFTYNPDGVRFCRACGMMADTRAAYRNL